jgi:Zn-dependent protease with chaperone function
MEPYPPVLTVLLAALAAALVAGFYLLGLGLVAGLAWLSWWLWLASPGPVAGEFGLLVAAAAAAAAVPAWRLLRARPAPPAGAAVTERQAPELWSQVRALAEAVGTRPPDEIRLWFDANAGVWEDARWLGLRAGRRYLYLGVPLLRVLSVAQLRAVVAHELGHYARHHTRLGVVTYRGGQVIAGTIAQIGPRRPVGRVLVGYSLLYFLVSMVVVRRMELAADRTAVRVAGREPFVRALRDTDRIGSAWAYFLACYVEWARTDGYAPAELLDWFGSTMEHRPDELAQWHRDGTPEPWSGWDFHPPVDDRVARAAAMPDPATAPDQRPAVVLVPDPDDLSAALRTVEFDRAVEQVAQAEAGRDAEWLFGAAATVLRHDRCRIGCVLDLLAAGRAEELRRALPVPDRAALAGVVLAAASGTVVDAEGGRWRHRSGEPIMLAGRRTLPVELRPQVARACHDPAGVAALRARLRELGVGSAVVTGRPGSWKAPLRLGPELRNRPEPRVAELLPERLFLLAYSPAGTRRLSTDVFETVLGAAVLAELRLRGRIRLAPTEAATIVVVDATPTGDPLLDPALDRVAGAREMPAYRWLQRLGSGVSGTLAERLLGPVSSLDRRQARAVTAQARAGIADALKTGALDGRELALGALLWGCELTGPVLGWTAFGTRFWLGRVAARDRLAVAIRIVIGLNMSLPGATGGGQ